MTPAGTVLQFSTEWGTWLPAVLSRLSAPSMGDHLPSTQAADRGCGTTPQPVMSPITPCMRGVPAQLLPPVQEPWRRHMPARGLRLSSLVRIRCTTTATKSVSSTPLARRQIFRASSRTAPMFTWSVQARAHRSWVPPTCTAPPSAPAQTGIGSMLLSSAGSQMPSSIQPLLHRLPPDADSH